VASYSSFTLSRYETMPPCYIIDPQWPAPQRAATPANLPLHPPVKQIRHGNIHSAAESVGEEGGERRVVNNRCETTCTSRHRPPLDNAATRRWGRGENTASCPADNLQSHRPPSRPTGQASRRPGHRSRQRTTVREVWTEVRGSSLIISNASNRFSHTAASAQLPISRIDTRDTRTRTRIHFDNRFFDSRLTCLVETNLKWWWWWS